MDMPFRGVSPPEEDTKNTHTREGVHWEAPYTLLGRSQSKLTQTSSNHSKRAENQLKQSQSKLTQTNLSRKAQKAKNLKSSRCPYSDKETVLVELRSVTEISPSILSSERYFVPLTHVSVISYAVVY